MYDTLNFFINKTVKMIGYQEILYDFFTRFYYNSLSLEIIYYYVKIGIRIN